MTRQEFLDDIIDMSDLCSFCWENGYDSFIEDIYSEDALDEWINDQIRDYDDWRDLYRFLDNVPTGYDWYRIDCYGDIEGLGDYEFNDLKDDLFRELDDDGFFDAPEDLLDPEELEELTEARKVQRNEQLAFESHLTSVLLAGA